MRRVVTALAVAAFVSLPAPRAQAAARAPGLSLGESRPVETALGNAALPDAGDVWVEMIRGATRSLDLEEFYFSHRRGEALQRVLDEIGRAAARGVKVRLLLDAGFYKTYPQPADSLGALANVSLRRVDYKRLTGGVQHAKYFIVDSRDAWIGSQNLDWRSLSQIHELGIRIREPRLAGAIETVFETDWGAADTSHAFAPATLAPLVLPVRAEVAPGDTASAWLGASPRATNPVGIPWDRDLLVARLNGARRDIVAQVLQYGVSVRGGADSTLHHALLAAAARGVRVRLLVSDWAIGGKNEAALHDLTAHGVEVKISRVPEWSRGYVPFARVEHCKYMVADSEWLWIGTSNWEPGYFLDTRNLGLTVHSATLAAQAAAVFTASWNAPSALAYGADTRLEPRIHGATPPPGVPFYGE